MIMLVIFFEGKIDWIIFLFFVLILKFVKVSVLVRGFKLNVLFMVEDEVWLEFGVKVICLKWCYIMIEYLWYLVVWEFREEFVLVLYLLVENGNEIIFLDGNVSGDDRDYIFFFKVFGVVFKY